MISIASEKSQREATSTRVDHDVRLLVMFPGALGDLLLLAPAVAALARAGAAVELGVQRALVPLLGRVVPGRSGPAMDGAVVGSLFGNDPSEGLRVWIRGADHVHAWLARAGDPDVLAWRLRALGARAVSLHAVVRDPGPCHASDEYARMLGVSPSALTPLGLGCERRSRASEVAPPPEAGTLVIHPGAGSEAKRWARTGFRRVADGWRAAGGTAVVLLGPAEEADAEFWQGTGHPVVAARDLGEVATLLERTSRYVGSDSGISHLAGALGRAGIVLFGPTDPERWRPRCTSLTIVRFGAASEEAALAATLVSRLTAPEESQRQAPRRLGYLDTPTHEH